MLTHLSLAHFKTFRAEVNVPLNEPGLTIVRGVHRTSRAKSANGVGKSAIWSGLCWVLYGRTLEGARGDDVACRFTTDTCRGEVGLDIDGVHWTAVRTRRPQSFTLTAAGQEPLQQEAAERQLAAMLRWGYSTFASAFVFGQRAIDFATAKPEDQRKVFNDILGLDFTDAHANALRWRKSTVARAATEGQETERTEWELRSMEERMASLEEQRRTFQQHQQELVEGAEAGVTTRREELEAALAALGQLQTMVRQHLRREAAVAAWEAWSEAEALALAAEATARRDLSEAVAAQQTVNRRLDGLLRAGHCPTCLGDVSDAPAVRRRFASEQNQAKDRAAQARSALALAGWTVTEHQTEKPEVMQRTTWERQRSDLAVAWTRQQAAVAQAQALVEKAEAALTEVRGQTFFGAEELTRLRRHRAAMTATLGRQRARHTRLTVTAQVADYWVEAFAHRLSNLVLESVEPYLQERAAAHLAILARGEARAAVSALERLKSGVRERVSVVAEWEDGAASFRDASPGEDRRTSLALYAALQDLAEQRSAQRFPVKVFDEPSDALDARGKEILYEWIRGQMHDRPTVFLVTHDELFAASLQPEHIWTVVMDRQGARIERE